MTNLEVALSLIPLIILNCFIVVAFIIFLILRSRGMVKKPPYIPSNGERATFVLGSTPREFWLWFTGPVARVLVAYKVSPNLISTVGLLLSMVAAAFYYTGHIGTAGYVLILGSSCDYLDGWVARATNRQSRLGIFYDAVLDRIIDTVLLMGIAGYFRHTNLVFIPMIILIALFMNAWAGHRVERLGVQRVWGLIERPEFMFLLAVVTLLDPVVQGWAITQGLPDKHYALVGGLSVLAILTSYTTYERVTAGLHALAQLDRAETDRT